MVKINVISGFLGAGKTTLIKKLLTGSLRNEKVVLLENEYGEIGIDGGFMKDAGITVTELNAGCICCTLAGDFQAAVDQLIDTYHPDRILVEPTGVGKLSEILSAVEKAKTRHPEIEIGDRHQGDGGYLTLIEDAAQIRGELAGAHLVLLHEIGRRPEDAELAIGVAGARYDADLYRDPADTAGGAEGISGSGLDDTSRLGRILGE